MPCLLKQPTERSAGIVSFTQNELFWGIPSQSEAAELLSELSDQGRWLFGAHVQGELSWLADWPLAEWHSFVLWPDPDATFLHNVPEDRRIPLNCINFLPDQNLPSLGQPKKWDVCIVSRASEIKRIRETLFTLRALLDLDPTLRFVVIVPDWRDINLGERNYTELGADRSFYELPLQLFSARELEQISFLCSSVPSFGRMPLSSELLLDLISDSRFVYLPSHNEGTPRILAEAMLVGTPCLIAAALKTPMRKDLNERNSLALPDEPADAAAGILEGLRNYNRFQPDVDGALARYGASRHVGHFRDLLATSLRARGQSDEGQWYLEDLHFRLACHGQKTDMQLMQGGTDVLARWLALAEREDPYDEDVFFGSVASAPHSSPVDSQRTFTQRAGALFGRSSARGRE